ncbi:MAG: family 1 encapsulin nanocompartment shell protein [Candidatus Nanopelagicales bacterium]
MDHLLREIAPISDAGWAEIEGEATRSLRHYLAARKLVDYSVSGDWTTSALPLGRVSQVPTTAGGVEPQTRLIQPFTDLRVPFQISRRELDALDRGANDFDTDPVIAAARAAALAEDEAVLAGNAVLGISGVGSASTNEVVSIDANFSDFPDSVAKALDILQEESIAGPYAMAMGPRCWTGVMESSEKGGYPLIKHLNLMLDLPVVWAPSVEGALLLSQRGGDYEIRGGQDWSIGYLEHDHETVTLYLEESFTSLVNTPEAAVRFDFVQ